MGNPPKKCKCDICGTEFFLSDNSWRYKINRYHENAKFYCPNCRKAGRKMDRKFLESQLSDEEKLKRKRELSERAKKQWASYDEKRRKEIHEIFSNAQSKRIQNMSEEELIEFKKQQSEKARQLALNRTPEQKEEFSRKCSIRSKNMLANMSDEQRNSIRNKQSIGLKRYISTLPENVLSKRMDNLTRRASEVWDSLSPKEKSYRTIKRLRNTNKYFTIFNQTFEKFCKEYNLYDTFDIIREFPMYNIDAHCWDYAIFDKSGRLIMLVDIDGGYHHSKEHDYDGSRFMIKYEYSRSLSINDANIMVNIIYGDKFESCFKRMIKFINLTYDEYLETLIKEYIRIPFPTPKYHTKDLLSSYNDLYNMNCNDKYHRNISMNSRNGNMLCLTFHNSIWNIKIGELSPADAWKDPRILKELIENHYLYHSYLNMNKILLCFDIIEKYIRKQFMSAGQSKMIINRYLSDYNIIFDPFSGYSGRLLGTISLGKQYIGQSNDELLTKESNEMITFLHHYGIEFNVTVQTIVTSNDFGCMFTEVDNDEMIDCCLKKYNCDIYIYVFSIKNTSRYTAFIIDKIFDAKLIRISKHSRDDIIHDI